jgi:hypothetical protein
MVLAGAHRRRAATCVCSALPSFAKQVRTVIEVGESEERLAQGDFKMVTPGCCLEKRPEVSPIVGNCRKFDILGRTGGTKVNAFSNQNWP